VEALLIYLPFLVTAIVAQFGERTRWARPVTYGLLVATNLGLWGVAGLALLNQLAKIRAPTTLQPAALAANWPVVALACVLTSLVAFLPLIRQVRTGLARWLPIDPSSLVHTTALVFVVYEIGLNLGQMALVGSLESLTSPELALTISDVLLTDVPLLLFALLGVGLFVRRDLGSTVERLGLRRPTWRHLAAAAGLLVLLLALNQGLDLLWQRVDPASYDLVSRVTDNLFGGLSTLGGALVLGLSAGISEELLFRGAVQPRLGILLTTVLFSVGHLQYGLTLAMLQVFIIGLVLGWVRQRANTTTGIVIHASYNILIVLLGLIQT
jgi:membrane protease YdiL (CAAX protease family)